jgi:hypothetical protein
MENRKFQLEYVLRIDKQKETAQRTPNVEMAVAVDAGSNRLAERDAPHLPTNRITRDARDNEEFSITNAQ